MEGGRLCNTNKKECVQHLINTSREQWYVTKYCSHLKKTKLSGSLTYGFSHGVDSFVVHNCVNKLKLQEKEILLSTNVRLLRETQCLCECMVRRDVYYGKNA